MEPATGLSPVSSDIQDRRNSLPRWHLEELQSIHQPMPWRHRAPSHPKALCMVGSADKFAPTFSALPMRRITQAYALVELRCAKKGIPARTCTWSCAFARRHAGFYTTGTFKKLENKSKRPMPVTLRRDLFDRQAGCYYINGAFIPEPGEMAGFGIAPNSHRLQRRANLPQLSSLGWEGRREIVLDGLRSAKRSFDGEASPQRPPKEG